MYFYIAIYISVIVGKLFLDIENDIRLETYRSSCKGTGAANAIQEFLVQ